MATKTEGQHRAEYLVSEANGHRSRKTVTLASGVNYKAGHVLGKITSSGKFTEYDDDASDGSQTAAAVLYDNVDATSEDKSAVVHIRDCEVNQHDLVFKSDQTAEQKANAYADLEAFGIIVRS